MTGSLRIDAEGVHVPPALAGELRDALMIPLAAAVRASGGTLRLSDSATEFLHSLSALDAVAHRPAMSEFGHHRTSAAIVVDMMSPDDAGREVGMTGRNVRRLCAAGLVNHQLTTSGRYLVDVGSLKTHLRGDAR